MNLNHTADICNKRLIATAILFGVATTILKYGGFGISDHTEQLPLIYRNLNRNYLPHDFFVNNGNESLARVFYSRLMAFLAGSDKWLPFVFFIATMLVNVSISVITYFFAGRFFNNSGISGLYAAAAVMLVDTFALGWNTTIYHTVLIPASIAIPFLLGAVWATFEKRVVTATLLCILAALFHPLMGLESGYLLLFTFVLSTWYEKQFTSARLKRVLLSAALLIGCTAAVAYFEYNDGQQLPATQFIYILAHLRHPHHYLPGSFAVSDYMHGGTFMLTILAILFSRSGRNHQYNIKAVILGISILLLCVGGYIFVEIFPTRLWTTAQPFRLLYFIKWLGLVLIAGNINTYKVAGWQRLLLVPAMANTYIMLCSNILLMGIEKISIHNKYRNMAGVFTGGGILLTILWLKSDMYLLHWCIFVLLILLIANYYRFVPRVLWGSLLLITILLLASNTVRTYARQKVAAHTEKVNNYFKLDGKSYFASSEIITYIRTKTGEDNIILTPPLWGELRLHARRAIVVDFKAFPFNDMAMLEWYNRMTNCYGETTQRGFAAIGDYNNNYMAIDDTKLVELKSKYGCSYAVLYNVTPTSFPIVSGDNYYKLVVIP